MNTDHPFDLSIVIPVYNETQRIETGLARVMEYARNLSIKTQIVVVDDGSADGTAATARRLLSGFPDGLVIEGTANRGKGHAVKTGMLRAQGAVRLFTDIDLSVPIETADEYLRYMNSGAEIVIGTRKVKASQVMVHQPYYREVLGGFFRMASRILCAPPITDFTCGFKAFSAPATAAIFSQSRIERWSFDAEILFLAYRMGFRVVQHPVTWIDSADTRVNLGLDMIRSLCELLAVRGHSFMGRYVFAKSYQGAGVVMKENPLFSRQDGE